MANGVEVIIKGNQATPLLRLNERMPTAVGGAMVTTLPPTTVSNQFHLMEHPNRPNTAIHHLLHSVARSATPDLLTRTMMTTFTYFQTVLQNQTTVVRSSEQVVSNVVTEAAYPEPTVHPLEFASMLEPIELEMSTLTHLSTFTFSKTVFDLNGAHVQTQLETLTDFVVVPGNPTPWQTFFTTFTTYFTSLQGSKVVTKISTSVTSNVVIPSQATPLSSTVGVGAVEEQIRLQPIMIYATKTFYTTTTFLTSILDNNSETKVQSRTSVVSNVVTEAISTVLNGQYLLSLESSYLAEHPDTVQPSTHDITFLTEPSLSIRTIEGTYVPDTPPSRFFPHWPKDEAVGVAYPESHIRATPTLKPPNFQEMRSEINHLIQDLVGSSEVNPTEVTTVLEELFPTVGSEEFFTQAPTPPLMTQLSTSVPFTVETVSAVPLEPETESSVAETASDQDDEGIVIEADTPKSTSPPLVYGHLKHPIGEEQKVFNLISGEEVTGAIKDKSPDYYDETMEETAFKETYDQPAAETEPTVYHVTETAPNVTEPTTELSLETLQQQILDEIPTERFPANTERITFKFTPAGKPVKMASPATPGTVLEKTAGRPRPSKPEVKPSVSAADYDDSESLGNVYNLILPKPPSSSTSADESEAISGAGTDDESSKDESDELEDEQLRKPSLSGPPKYNVIQAPPLAPPPASDVEVSHTGNGVMNWNPLLKLGALGLGGLGASALTKWSPLLGSMAGYLKTGLVPMLIARNDTLSNYELTNQKPPLRPFRLQAGQGMQMEESGSIPRRPVLSHANEPNFRYENGGQHFQHFGQHPQQPMNMHVVLTPLGNPSQQQASSNHVKVLPGSAPSRFHSGRQPPRQEEQQPPLWTNQIILPFPPDSNEIEPPDNFKYHHAASQEIAHLRPPPEYPKPLNSNQGAHEQFLRPVIRPNNLPRPSPTTLVKANPNRPPIGSPPRPAPPPPLSPPEQKGPSPTPFLMERRPSSPIPTAITNQKPRPGPGANGSGPKKVQTIPQNPERPTVPPPTAASTGNFLRQRPTPFDHHHVVEENQGPRPFETVQNFFSAEQPMSLEFVPINTQNSQNFQNQRPQHNFNQVQPQQHQHPVHTQNQQHQHPHTQNQQHQHPAHSQNQHPIHTKNQQHQHPQNQPPNFQNQHNRPQFTNQNEHFITNVRPFQPLPNPNPFQPTKDAGALLSFRPFPVQAGSDEHPQRFPAPHQMPRPHLQNFPPPRQEHSDEAPPTIQSSWEEPEGFLDMFKPGGSLNPFNSRPQRPLMQESSEEDHRPRPPFLQPRPPYPQRPPTVMIPFNPHSNYPTITLSSEEVPNHVRLHQAPNQNQPFSQEGPNQNPPFSQGGANHVRPHPPTNQNQPFGQQGPNHGRPNPSTNQNPPFGQELQNFRPPLPQGPMPPPPPQRFPFGGNGQGLHEIKPILNPNVLLPGVPNSNHPPKPPSTSQSEVLLPAWHPSPPQPASSAPPPIRPTQHFQNFESRPNTVYIVEETYDPPPSTESARPQLVIKEVPSEPPTTPPAPTVSSSPATRRPTFIRRSSTTPSPSTTPSDFKFSLFPQGFQFSSTVNQLLDRVKPKPTRPSQSGEHSGQVKGQGQLGSDEDFGSSIQIPVQGRPDLDNGSLTLLEMSPSDELMFNSEEKRILNSFRPHKEPTNQEAGILNLFRPHKEPTNQEAAESTWLATTFRPTPTPVQPTTFRNQLSLVQKATTFRPRRPLLSNAPNQVPPSRPTKVWYPKKVVTEKSVDNEGLDQVKLKNVEIYKKPGFVRNYQNKSLLAFVPASGSTEEENQIVGQETGNFPENPPPPRPPFSGEDEDSFETYELPPPGYPAMRLTPPPPPRFNQPGVGNEQRPFLMRRPAPPNDDLPSNNGGPFPSFSNIFRRPFPQPSPPKDVNTNQPPPPGKGQLLIPAPPRWPHPKPKPFQTNHREKNYPPVEMGQRQPPSLNSLPNPPSQVINSNYFHKVKPIPLNPAVKTAVPPPPTVPPTSPPRFRQRTTKETTVAPSSTTSEAPSYEDENEVEKDADTDTAAAIDEGDAKREPFGQRPRPSILRPFEKRPTDSRPSNLQPSQTRPSNPRPWDSRPSDSRPSNLRPSDSQSSDLRPSDSRPLDSRPSDSRPLDSRPSDSRPSNLQPSQTRPSNPRPWDSRPLDSRPSDSRPLDSRPSDPQPPEPRPSEPGPSDLRPAADGDPFYESDEEVGMYSPEFNYGNRQVGGHVLNSLQRFPKPKDTVQDDPKAELEPPPIDSKRLHPPALELPSNGPIKIRQKPNLLRPQPNLLRPQVPAKKPSFHTIATVDHENKIIATNVIPAFPAASSLPPEIESIPPQVSASPTTEAEPAKNIEPTKPLIIGSVETVDLHGSPVPQLPETQATKSLLKFPSRMTPLKVQPTQVPKPPAEIKPTRSFSRSPIRSTATFQRGTRLRIPTSTVETPLDKAQEVESIEMQQSTKRTLNSETAPDFQFPQAPPPSQFPVKSPPPYKPKKPFTPIRNPAEGRLPPWKLRTTTSSTTVEPPWSSTFRYTQPTTTTTAEPPPHLNESITAAPASTTEHSSTVSPSTVSTTPHPLPAISTPSTPVQLESSEEETLQGEESVEMTPTTFRPAIRPLYFSTPPPPRENLTATTLITKEGPVVAIVKKVSISTASSISTKLPAPKPTATRYVTHSDTVTESVTETAFRVLPSSDGYEPVTETVILTTIYPPETVVSTILGSVTLVNTLQIQPTTVRTTILSQPTKIPTPPPPPPPESKETVVLKGSAPFMPTASNESTERKLLKGGSGILIRKVPAPALNTPPEAPRSTTPKPTVPASPAIVTASPESAISTCNETNCSAGNQMCRGSGAAAKCGCKGGYARMRPNFPCRPTFTYEMSVSVKGMNERELVGMDKNTTKRMSATEEAFMSQTAEALEAAFMATDLRRQFQGTEVLKMKPRQPSTVYVDFLLQLTVNMTQDRIRSYLIRTLRNSNFTVGHVGLLSPEASADFSARDFNECSYLEYNDCSPNANCINLPGSFTCECKEGFKERKRHRPGRDCFSLVGCPECNFKGTCLKGPHGQGPPGQMSCDCFRWYGGADCRWNLKILLMGVVGVGSILFCLVIICTVITCRRRPRPNGVIREQRPGSGRFMRYRSPTSQATLERTAIMHDTASSTGSEDLPIQRSQPHPSYTPDSLADQGQSAYKSQQRKNDQNLINFSLRTHEMSPMSVVIPRAKIRLSPNGRGQGRSSAGSGPSVSLGPPGIDRAGEQKLLNYLEGKAASKSSAAPQTTLQQEKEAKFRKLSLQERRISTGALVSSGTEVSARGGMRRRSTGLEPEFHARVYDKTLSDIRSSRASCYSCKAPSYSAYSESAGHTMAEKDGASTVYTTQGKLFRLTNDTDSNLSSD